MKKYRGLLKQLEDFAKRRGLRYVRQLDLQALRDFRNSWADGAISGKKKLERLRSFFRFALQSNWVKQTPVITMRTPKVSHPPTLPFSKAEIEKILWACDLYPDNGRYRKGTLARLKVLTLLMRYTGLRVGDAVTLATDRIADDKLFLYTQKTKVPVCCPLPEVVLEALDDIEPVSDKHFFWTGASDTRSITGHRQRRFQKLFKLSGVKDAHPHRSETRFRWSCSSPLEQVSILLGHSSVRITERHYSPWILARQEQLEAAVRKAW